MKRILLLMFLAAVPSFLMARELPAEGNGHSAGKTCTAAADCGEGEICDAGRCTAAPDCSGGRVFTDGTCACPPDKPVWDGTSCHTDPCVNIRCSGGKSCRNGTCVCPDDRPYWSGLVCSGDPCVQISCPPGRSCLSGVCADCALGEKCGCPQNEEADGEGGCRAPSSCGGKICAPGEICRNGQCGVMCDSRGCASSEFCATAENVCTADGCCVKGYSDPALQCFMCAGFATSCATHADCMTGEECLRGVCRPCGAGSNAEAFCNQGSVPLPPSEPLL